MEKTSEFINSLNFSIQLLKFENEHYKKVFIFMKKFLKRNEIIQDSLKYSKKLHDKRRFISERLKDTKLIAGTLLKFSNVHNFIQEMLNLENIIESDKASIFTLKNKLDVLKDNFEKTVNEAPIFEEFCQSNNETIDENSYADSKRKRFQTCTNIHVQFNEISPVKGMKGRKCESMRGPMREKSVESKVSRKSSSFVSGAGETWQSSNDFEEGILEASLNDINTNSSGDFPLNETDPNVSLNFLDHFSSEEQNIIREELKIDIVNDSKAIEELSENPVEKPTIQIEEKKEILVELPKENPQRKDEGEKGHVCEKKGFVKFGQKLFETFAVYIPSFHFNEKTLEATANYELAFEISAQFGCKLRNNLRNQIFDQIISFDIPPKVLKNKNNFFCSLKLKLLIQKKHFGEFQEQKHGFWVFKTRNSIF